MISNHGLLVFIDEVNYKNILDKCISMHDLSNSIVESKHHSKLSPITNYSLLLLQNTLNKCLFDETNMINDYYNNISVLTDAEKKYAKDSIVSHITSKNKDLYIDSNSKQVYLPQEDTQEHSAKKYYDLVSMPDNNIVVIVKEAFFTNVIGIKKNLEKFLLDCLYQFYKFGVNSRKLTKLYINLKFSDSYFDLVNLRFN